MKIEDLFPEYPIKMKREEREERKFGLFGFKGTKNYSDEIELAFFR